MHLSTNHAWVHRVGHHLPALEGSCTLDSLVSRHAIVDGLKQYIGRQIGVLLVRGGQVPLRLGPHLRLRALEQPVDHYLLLGGQGVFFLGPLEQVL